jgi:hypothetical protein
MGSGGIEMESGGLQLRSGGCISYAKRKAATLGPCVLAGARLVLMPKPMGSGILCGSSGRHPRAITSWRVPTICTYISVPGHININMFILPAKFLLPTMDFSHY